MRVKPDLSPLLIPVKLSIDIQPEEDLRLKSRPLIVWPSTTLSSNQMDSANGFSSEWLDSELQSRLESHIAAGHPWKQLLHTASQETVPDVYQTLQAYALLWYPFESVDKATALGLCDAAERDVERGLSFIREVEKGSHMRNDTVLGFRPEAIKALCELCQGRIDALKPRSGENDWEEGGQDEDGENEEEESRETIGGARAPEAVKELIGMVYRCIEPQFKTRLQLLIHQHKTKTRRK